MNTLFEAVQKHAGLQAATISKHLRNAKIRDFSDLTRAGVMNLRDELRQSLAPSSAKTVAAALVALLRRYEDEGVIPCKDYATILRLMGEAPVKTYLNESELERLERVDTRTVVERVVLNEFLVGTKTGARLSDIRELTEENVDGTTLTYTSKKTGITASIPCSNRTVARLRWLRTNGRVVDTATFNKTIRRLCKRAGIDEQVKVHKGGKDEVGPKWKFISSHSARISVATNLSANGTPLTDIRDILGHTGTAMTSRYVCRREVKLNEKSLALFR